MSDNITLRSVIGRFLEHSRVYAFANGTANPVDYEYYIGSADWMYRNLSARVECITPVQDTDARARLAQLFDIILRDRRSAWRISPEGRSEQLMPDPDAAPDTPETTGTFATLMKLAAGA
jgi:polyphosphate kinase